MAKSSHQGHPLLKASQKAFMRGVSGGATSRDRHEKSDKAHSKTHRDYEKRAYKKAEESYYQKDSSGKLKKKTVWNMKKVPRNLGVQAAKAARRYQKKK